ncbi:MAG: DUF6531 domain-containing protein [Sulfuricellaceae bacterium]|nr:DUF6531 domain-containing protein [Sulfuricellaceae bacterium]
MVNFYRLIIVFFMFTSNVYAAVIPPTVVFWVVGNGSEVVTSATASCASFYPGSIAFDSGRGTDAFYPIFSCQKNGVIVGSTYGFPGCSAGYSLSVDPPWICTGEPPSPPPPVDEPKNRGGCTTCPCVLEGNPINSKTGNKFQAETDYIGGGDHPLKITRAYNSISSSNSSIGYDWVLDWESYKVTNPSTVLTRAYVGRPENKQYTFALQNGAWVSDADVTGKLQQSVNSSGATTGWQYTKSDGQVETYAADGTLRKIALPGGWFWTVSPSGSTTHIADPFGRTLTLAYDSSNNRTITDAAGGVYTYQKDSNGRLVSVTYPDGKVRTYLYENTAFPFALTGIVDENGQRFSTYAYDSQERATLTQHAGGADSYSLTYNADGSTTVTDPLGAERTRTFAIILGVAKSTGASQPGGAGCGPAASAVTYDANGNIASRTDFNGITTTYTYDLTRNLELSRTEAVGTPQARTITTAWHPAYRLPVRVAEPGRTTDYSYDAQGNLLVKTVTDTASGASRSWRYTYNQYGQVLSADGPRTDVADVTSYTYDAQGNLASVTNPLGQTTRYTAYDPNGRPLSVIDPNGVLTTLAYDPRGRLTSRDVGGETTAYAYDGVGQVIQVTLPDGRLVAYTYDAAHRLTNVADGAGDHIAYTLDGLGKRIGEDTYDPAGALAKSLSRAYDALGRLQSLTGVGAE